jgi:hypothetical protein
MSEQNNSLTCRKGAVKTLTDAVPEATAIVEASSLSTLSLWWVLSYSRCSKHGKGGLHGNELL